MSVSVKAPVPPASGATNVTGTVEKVVGVGGSVVVEAAVVGGFVVEATVDGVGDVPPGGDGTALTTGVIDDGAVVAGAAVFVDEHDTIASEAMLATTRERSERTGQPLTGVTMIVTFPGKTVPPYVWSTVSVPPVGAISMSSGSS